MTKKRNLFTACCLFVAAILLAVYGAGFSWRKVLVAGVALLLCRAGVDFVKLSFNGEPFTRYRFSIQLSGLALAFREAGLYNNQIPEAAARIQESMIGYGSIFFTWLEPRLFYVNTTNHYASTPNLWLNLPASGDSKSLQADRIEMRRTAEGYELVLVTTEQIRASHGRTTDEGLVLFCLPHRFLRALQDDARDRHKKTIEILASVGVNYEKYEDEISISWFRNQYCRFGWWEI